MTILVCPLSKVTSTITSHEPGRVVSLLDPGSMFPELGPEYVDRHLCLSFHDIHVPTEEDQIVPAGEHVDRLIRFVAEWSRGAPLLIHCRAGISRSTAAAFIAACFHNPRTPELDIAVALRRASALARPNATMIRLADDAMRRHGRMIEAITETGRDLPGFEVDENEPFQLPSTWQR